MPYRAVEAETNRLAIAAGLAIRTERLRRGLTLRTLADLAEVGVSTAYAVESGRIASLETYVRLAIALRLRPELLVFDPRRRGMVKQREEDPVHAAMGELEAARLRSLGFEVGLDEPFQHFQHAGRADVVAWSRNPAALLHLENKTRIENLQGLFGTYNAKRAYLAAELAGRVGVERWASETHVVVGLWSAEVLHQIRRHKASFEVVCPDPSTVFASWWTGVTPEPGKKSTLVILDPAGLGAHQWSGLETTGWTRPRYRDYRTALEALAKTQ